MSVKSNDKTAITASTYWSVPSATQWTSNMEEKHKHDFFIKNKRAEYIINILCATSLKLIIGTKFQTWEIISLSKVIPRKANAILCYYGGNELSFLRVTSKAKASHVWATLKCNYQEFYRATQKPALSNLIKQVHFL